MSLPSPVPGLTVLEVLGYGGFAVVYRARQESVGREVALKVDNRFAQDERDRRRFLREARAAGALSDHPNVISVYDAGITGEGHPYLVMELCPGGSLADRLRKDGPMRPGEVRGIGVKIADALASAHEAGVMHRDLKPANILINRFGAPGLTDFGMAASYDAAREMSATLDALTPAYAAPEVFRMAQPTAAVDVYGLGATLYSLLSGRPPRWPDAGHPSIAAIINLADQPLPDVKGVPSALTAVLRTAMATDPAHRYPNAATFRDALQGVSLELPTGVFAVIAADDPPRRREGDAPPERHPSQERSPENALGGLAGVGAPSVRATASAPVKPPPAPSTPLPPVPVSPAPGRSRAAALPEPVSPGSAAGGQLTSSGRVPGAAGRPASRPSGGGSRDGRRPVPGGSASHAAGSEPTALMSASHGAAGRPPSPPRAPAPDSRPAGSSAVTAQVPDSASQGGRHSAGAKPVPGLEVSQSVTGTQMITLPAMPPDPSRRRHPSDADQPADDDSFPPDRAAARRRTVRLALLAILLAAALGIGLAIVINKSVGGRGGAQSTGRITLPTPGRADDAVPPPVAEPKASLVPSPEKPTSTASPGASRAPASPFLDADARIVTPGGLGPFRLGAAVAPAIKAGAATGSAQGQCGSASAVLATEPQYQDPGSGRRLSAHVSNGRITYVTVWTATHRTKSGLGVGSSLGAVVASSASAEQFGDANAGSVLVKDSNGGAVLFVFRGGAARALVAGPAGAVRPLAERAAPDPADLTLFC